MNLTILKTKADLESWRHEVNGFPIYFIPTMGGIHKGHKKIIEIARRLSEKNKANVVVSIFVNPLQFEKGEDYEKYPREFNKDCKEAYNAGANVIWAPKFEDLFPGGEDAHFKIQAPIQLQRHLCGAFRKKHFDGVATVVVRLIKQLRPNKIFLGEKDWQQLVILRKMVKDLSIPLKIQAIPTIRDTDGLPYSSRNLYLSREERSKALALPQVMTKASTLYKNNECIKIDSLKKILEDNGLKVEYLEIVDAHNLNPINDNKNKLPLIAAAIFCGQTRLIDHTFLMNRNPIVAIDGPAGAGKSTVTKRFAQKLGLVYLDTGAMYRAVTWLIQQQNIDHSNDLEVSNALDNLNLDIKLLNDGNQKVLLNDIDITNEIRSPKVTSEVSLFASNKIIREKLTAQQQKIGKKGGLVAEGRDIGTSVFPDADLKIFLTASANVRARRRAYDLKNQGYNVPEISELEAQIKERDHLDATRKISPLLKAEDAQEIVTDGMNIEEVIDCLIGIFRNRIPEEIWSTIPR